MPCPITPVAALIVRGNPDETELAAVLVVLAMVTTKRTPGQQASTTADWTRMRRQPPNSWLRERHRG